MQSLIGFISISYPFNVSSVRRFAPNRERLMAGECEIVFCESAFYEEAYRGIVLMLEADITSCIETFHG
jgi:hypothetical protein